MSSTQAPGRARLPVPARDRRPALAALALLLVVLGALGSALIVYRTGNKVDVLVVAKPLAAGQRATSADFSTVRVSSDDARLVPATLRGTYVGAYAVTTIPQGTLVNPQMFKAKDVLPTNGVVVGVVVDQEHRPADPLLAGDVVRAYLVPKDAQSGANAAVSTVVVTAARVVSVVDTSSGTGSGDSESVSLLVGATDAAALTPGAAAGTIALALLPAGTSPTIDFLGS